MVKSSPGLGDGGSVTQHAHGTLDLGQVTAGYNGWWLVVDTDFETSWAPVDELDSSLGLDGGDCGVDVLGYDVTSVQHTAGHVFTVTWITFHHLIGWLEASVGDLGHGELFVVSLLSGDNWGVCGEREVDTWVGDQVGLELCQVDVEGTVEPERGSDGAYNLTNQSVQVGVGWSLNIEITPADVVDGLVVDHEGAVGVFQCGVGGQNRVVGFNNSGGNLWSWVDCELKLGLFAVVDTETFHQKGGETRPGATAETVEDQETLETGTLVGQLPDSVQDKVNDFFANGVVTSCVIVGGVLLAGDQLFRMEQLSVGASAHFI